MKKAIKWTFILTPIVVLAIIIINMVSFHGSSMNGQFMQQVSLGSHGMRGGGGVGHSAFHQRGGMMNQSFLVIPFLLAIVAKLGLVVAGWLLWLRGKSNTTKLVGGIMLAIGLIALLPVIIAIPLIVLIGYLLYKSVNNGDTNVQELMTPQDLVIPTYTTSDLLDEWEKKIRREEK